MMRKIRVLVIFDDPYLRQGVASVFEASGYETKSISSIEYLSLVRDQFRPDIAMAWVYFHEIYRQIITDLVMYNIPTILTSTISYKHFQKPYLAYRHNINFLPAIYESEEMISMAERMTKDLRDDLQFLDTIYEDAHHE